MASREQVAVALFNKFKAFEDRVTQPLPAGKLRLVSRSLRHWEEMDSADMPCLFLAEGDEQTNKPDTRGVPYIWTRSVKLYLYISRGNDETLVIRSTMNDLLDLIEATISPDVKGQRQTLGGLVQDCRIIGKIETDEGTMGTLAVAIVPLEILVAQ
jgi:hypothetical protein